MNVILSTLCTLFLILQVLPSSADPNLVLKNYKFPNKPKPIYPIDANYGQIGGVAVSPLTDEIYFSDESLGQIYKISGDQIFLVAGAAGGSGYKDGHVISAKFVTPLGLSFHPNGTLLAVADSWNHIIRIIDLTKGVVFTLAGNPGKNGYQDGIGFGAKFYRPYDLVFVGDFLFIADTSNCYIRKIEYPSGVVTTIAGTGKTGWGLAEGDATKVSLWYPFNLLYDFEEELLYIADSWNGAIRSVNSTGYLKTVFRDEDVLGFQWGMVKKGRSLIASDHRNAYLVAIDIDTKTWSVYAGTKGLPGLFDGQKKDAQLNIPHYLAMTKNEDIWIVDYGNNAIRAISNSSNYLFTAVRQIGTGNEDGESFQALFSDICRILFDDVRNVLYVTDTGNHAIRKVDIDQGYRVETLTGKPYSGFLDGSFSDAIFNSPNSVIFDPNDRNILYVSDTSNRAIRMLNLTDGIVTTAANLISNPFDMEFDPEGNLFVSLQGVILKVDAGLKGGGTVFAGSGWYDCKDGDATTAAMAQIESLIYFPENGRMIFTDCQCTSIRYVTLADRRTTTLAGSLGTEPTAMIDGSFGKSRFHCPNSLSRKGDIMFVTDGGFNAIRYLDLNSSLVFTLFGGRGSGYRNGNLSIALLDYPTSISARSSRLNDTIYVFDSNNMAIRKVEDGQISTVAGFGAPIYNISDTAPSKIGMTNSIIALNVDELLLSDTMSNCIMKIKIVGDEMMEIVVIAGDGSFGWRDGKGVSSMLNAPTDMTLSVDRSSVYIVDTSNHIIRRLKLSTGEVTTFAGTGFAGLDIKPDLFGSSFNQPQAIAIDPSSSVIYLADSGNNCIKKINGTVISILAGSINAGFKNGPSTAALFAKPLSLVFDPFSQNLYVADTFNHAIRRIDEKRSVSTIVGINGTFGFVDGGWQIAKLNYPTKVVLGRYPGEILILDSGNRAVRIFHTSKLELSTLLIDPVANLQGIAVDVAGNVYISDTKSIRKILNPTKKTDTSTVSSGNLIVISVMGVILATLSLSFLIYYKFILKPKTKETLKILEAVGMKRVSEMSEATKTLSVSKTAAIAIPGYRRLDMKKCIEYPSNFGMTGKGGTASVFQAKLKDPKLIMEFGICEIVVKIFGNDTTIESFLYEVMIMNSLPKSPNVIELIGYSDKNELAIVMKSYPSNLRDLLVNTSFANTETNNLKISLDIANGMNLIHEKGIVHFDLKPANVLVEYNGEGITCVICDFGFANFVADVQDKIVKGVKKPSAIGITARYAAPELFAKADQMKKSAKMKETSDIEKKIDVYAYAMTTYYVYLRVPPWNDLTISDIEICAIGGNRPEIPPNKVPKKIEEMIKSGWSHDPDERPTFAEIQSILSSGE